MIELTLPYPPSVNHYKRVGRLTTTKNGKIYQPRVNSSATTRFYYEVWMKVRGMKIEGLGEADIHLDLEVYPPDKKKRDIDNILKPTIDALMNSGLFKDDSQISRLVVTRKSIMKHGQIIAIIRPA